jgi:hypothetical protein
MFVALGAMFAFPIACNEAERRGLVADAGGYVHAPAYPDGTVDKDELGNPVLDGKPDYDPKEVALAAAQNALQLSANPAELALWAAIGGVGLAVGWFKRRFLATTVKQAVLAASRGVIGKAPTSPEDPDEDVELPEKEKEIP